MIDTIFFDNWNTIVQAPNLMRAGSSTEIFHQYLLNQGIDITYEAFTGIYRSISKQQRIQADKEGYKELDYQNRLEQVFTKIGIPNESKHAEKAWKTYLDEWPKQTEFFPESPKILENLKGKYKLGVITNYMDGPTCRHVFEKLKFEEIFDVLVVSEEIGYRKPAMVIFEEALKEIGSTAETSIMVGDTYDADIVGANLMGMRNVFIDLFDNQHEYHSEATVVINNIGEFPKALEQLL